MRTNEFLIIPRFRHYKIIPNTWKEERLREEAKDRGRLIRTPASLCTSAFGPHVPYTCTTNYILAREEWLHVTLEAEKGGQRVTYLSWWSSRSAVRNRWKYRVRKVGTRGAGRGEGGGGSRLTVSLNSHIQLPPLHRDGPPACVQKQLLFLEWWELSFKSKGEASRMLSRSQPPSIPDTLEENNP